MLVIPSLRPSLLRLGLRHLSSSAPRTPSELFIDNQYVAAEGGASLDVHAPRDGSVFTTIANASKADVDAAVESSRRCFEGGWRDTSAADRADVVRRMGDELENRLEEFAQVESWDCGKPLSESRGDIQFCVDLFR